MKKVIQFFTMLKLFRIKILTASIFYLGFTINVYAQEIIGKTIHVGPGITKTVAEINAYNTVWEKQNVNKMEAPRPELELPNELPGVGEESRNFSKWPNDIPTNPNFINGVTQTIHSNFMATDFSTHSGGWPPDNNGDVGTTHIFIAQNFRMVAYLKPSITAPAATTPNGTSTVLLASPTMNVSQNAFFQTAFPGVSTTDPHVRFDRLTSRWFVVSMSTNETTNNYLLFAVSNSAAITGTAFFTFFRISISNFTGANPDAGNFLDYPTLGVDKLGLNIGANIFTSGGSFVQASVYVVNKANMIAGSLTITAFSGAGRVGGGNIRTPQGVQYDDPSGTEGYFIGSSAFFSQLIFRRVTYVGSIPSLSAETSLSTITYRTPLSQPALGTAGGNLDASNNRFFSAMAIKNKITGITTLWTSHTSAGLFDGTTSTISNTRNVCRWYEIQNLTATPSILQTGTFYDKAVSNPIGFWFPGIAMSGQGHSLLAASAAGVNDRCNIIIAGRYRTSASGDLEDSVYATATGSDYNPFGGPGPSFINRWGDYSQVGVDPQDNMTMWAFHQYCNTTNSYGVRAIQLKAPPPATPSLAAVPGCGANVAVTINGTSVNNSEFFDPGSDAGGPGFNRLLITCSGGITVTGTTFVTPIQLTCFLDTRGKVSGTYTLTITNPDGQFASINFNLAASCPLSVTLLSFTGKRVNNENELNWKAAAEYQLKAYEIEKSFDGINYQLINVVPPKGNISTTTSYQAFDKHPYPGNNYYRLKITEFTGEFTYSNIVLIKTEKKDFAITKMYPNPMRDLFTLEIFAEKNNSIQIDVFDMLGKKLVHKSVNLQAGPNEYKLNLSNLAAGNYFIQIKDLAGNFIEKTKLVKQ